MGGLGLGCPSEAGLLPQGGQGAEAGELEGPGVAGVLAAQYGGQAALLLGLQQAALLIR